MPEMKSCPYCGEEIRTEAVKCRYCRSRLVSFDLDRWHRSHPESKLAGVCASLAHVFGVSPIAVRLAFVFLTIFTHVGPLAYGALWLIIPRRPGGDSALEMMLRRALELAGMLGGRRDDSQSAPKWEHEAPDRWNKAPAPRDERPFSDAAH